MIASVKPSRPDSQSSRLACRVSGDAAGHPSPGPPRNWPWWAPHVTQTQAIVLGGTTTAVAAAGLAWYWWVAIAAAAPIGL